MSAIIHLRSTNTLEAWNGESVDVAPAELADPLSVLWAGAGHPDDPYIRLGSVLEIHKAHFPGDPARFPHYSPAPEGPDSCRVVWPDEVRQYHAPGPERWTDFKQIVGVFGRLRNAGVRTHNWHYPYEAVFSPAKVILHESDRPIRAYLTQEPVYPARGKLAVVRSPSSMAAAHVAVAMLNSALGLACYHRRFEAAFGRPPRANDALARDVLLELPLCHRDASAAETERAAELAYRVSTLFAAGQDCSEDFSTYVRPLRTALLSCLRKLLRLSPEAADDLVGYSRPWHPADAPDPQLTLSEVLDELPPLERVVLVNRDARRRMEQLEALSRKAELAPDEFHELGTLWRLRTWERRINGDSGKAGARDVWGSSVSESRQSENDHVAPPASGPRTTPGFPPDQAVLLERINAGPAPETWQRYHDLVARSRVGTLTAAERADLLALTDEIELANAARLQHLTELARLRGTTLRGVMRELGIYPASHA